MASPELSDLGISIVPVYSREEEGMMPIWWTMTGVAIVVFALAGYAIKRTRSWKSEATRAEGRIVGTRLNSSHDRLWLVEFATADGQTQDFTINTTHIFDRFHKDKIVPVLYHADDPASARLGTFGHLHMLPIILTLVGLIVLAVAMAKHPDIASQLRETTGLPF